MTLGNTATMGQTLYQCGDMITTPDGSALVCASGTITKLPMNAPITYSTGFPEFSAVTGRLTRVVGHWPTTRENNPAAVEVLWSAPSGRVLIGVVRSAGRYWVGVISGNEFTPLNVQWTLSEYDFGAW